MDRTAQGTVSFLPPVFIGQRMESRRKSTIWSLTLCECRRTMMSNLSMRKGLGFMMVVVVVIVVMVVVCVVVMVLVLMVGGWWRCRRCQSD